MKENIILGITGFLGGIILIVLVAALSSIPVMLLWDWLMPTLFGLKTITLFQAWELNFLCSMLFKGNSYNNNKVVKSEPKKTLIHG
jgi:hypothetical protein